MPFITVTVGLSGMARLTNRTGKRLVSTAANQFHRTQAMPASESRLRITFGLISESVQNLALQYAELLRLRQEVREAEKRLGAVRSLTLQASPSGRLNS